MSSIRFVTKNYCSQSAAVLKNGTGGGAPALEQLTGFPMTNAMRDDRGTVWSTTATPPSPLDLDIDLGSTLTIDTVGIMGLRYVGATDINFVTVKYGTTYLTWTTYATLTIPNGPLVLHDFTATAGTVSARYLRFEFAFGAVGQFTLAKVLAGAMVDLGYGYSPGGGQWEPRRSRLVMPAPSGFPTLVDMTDKTYTLSATFTNVPQTVRDKLVALADLPTTFLMLDCDDQPYEVYLTDSSVPWTDVFHPPYTVTLNVTSLP